MVVVGATVEVVVGATVEVVVGAAVVVVVGATVVVVVGAAVVVVVGAAVVVVGAADVVVVVPLAAKFKSKCTYALPPETIPVGTPSRIQSEHGLLESQVIAAPAPVWAASVPVPTMKSTVPDKFGGANPFCTKALEPTESGSVMQLPPDALN